MGRRRTNPPLQLPDRIPASELANWMRVNGISENLLALELSVRYRTVDGWLRGYRPAPAWLEQRINYRAVGPNAKLPRYGERWPDEPQPAPVWLPPAPVATPVATTPCEHCGNPLAPGADCTWWSCPGNDDAPPEDE